MSQCCVCASVCLCVFMCLLSCLRVSHDLLWLRSVCASCLGARFLGAIPKRFQHTQLLASTVEILEKSLLFCSSARACILCVVCCVFVFVFAYEYV